MYYYIITIIELVFYNILASTKDIRSLFTDLKLT